MKKHELQTKSPELSIILLNYNYAQYLPDALHSILSQTFKDFEVIIVNDGSTDSSLEVIQPFLEKYPFIQLVHNAENVGIVQSIHKGLENARGTYFYPFASDDVLMPDFLEKNIHYLRQSGAGLSCSEYAYFYDNCPEKIKTLRLIHENKPFEITPNQLQRMIKKKKFWIPGNTCLFKIDLFKNCRGFNESFHSHTDWFLALQIGFQYGIVYIPETIAAMRKHPSSYSVTQSLNRQIESWQNMMSYLNQRENKQLKKRFIKSDAFYSFDLPFLTFMLSKPYSFFFFKHRLWPRLLCRWFKKEIKPYFLKK